METPFSPNPRIRLNCRLDKVQRGNWGYIKPLQEGVWEIREFFGSGWRMSYIQHSDVVMVINLHSKMISSEQSNYLKHWRIKMVKVADLPSFDMAESLKTEEDIVIYLNMVLEENDPAELAHALSVIAKARVMTHIAK